jgi:uncharacterized protein YecE (DUF72 family)
MAGPPEAQGVGSPRPPRRILVGIAGWSYPDWRDTFYPAQREPGFSELRYAASRFDCLEINNTFYRLPEARISAEWLRAVRDLPGFLFTAKLTRDLTHGEPAISEVAPLSARFREGIEPIAASGRLGAVVAQFPHFFADTPANRDRIRTLAAGLRGLPVAVEVRHRSFLDPSPGGGLPFLGELGLNFVNIDLPASSTHPGLTTINTGPLGYFRLHGRNREAWFDAHASRDEKYNYLYSLEELRRIAELVVRVAARTQLTFVVANNHYRGKAPANARQLVTLLAPAAKGATDASGAPDAPLPATSAGDPHPTEPHP